MNKKNHNPWNKGLTKETSPKLKEIGNKISISKKGKQNPKLSKTLKGKKHKHVETCKCPWCEAKRGNNYAKRPEVRKKLHNRMLGNKNPMFKPKVKKYCETCGKEFFVVPSQMKFKFCSKECSSIATSIRMKKNNPMFNTKTAKKVHTSLKKKWQDSEYRKKMLPINFYKKRPTFLEKKLIDFINTENLPFKYTGDKTFWIGPCLSGKCRNPDFIHTDFKKIKKAIEVGNFTKQRKIDYNDKGIEVLHLTKKVLFSKEMPNIVRSFACSGLK